MYCVNMQCGIYHYVVYFVVVQANLENFHVLYKIISWSLLLFVMFSSFLIHMWVREEGIFCYGCSFLFGLETCSKAKEQLALLLLLFFMFLSLFTFSVLRPSRMLFLIRVWFLWNTNTLLWTQSVLKKLNFFCLGNAWNILL